jgi:hypothetical protein
MRSISESVEHILAGLDSLFIAVGLALASCAPGPAGVTAAVAAVTYDVAHKRWYGVVLSAASMIPIVGYVPGLLKVGMLLFELNRRLKRLLVLTPEIHDSPEALQRVRSALGKYYSQFPKIRLVRPIRKQLEEIMDFDNSGRMRRSAPY